MDGKLAQASLFKRLLSFLEQAYDPKLVFSMDFDPFRYFEHVIHSLSTILGYDLLVLRGESPANPNELIVISTTIHGIGATPYGV